MKYLVLGSSGFVGRRFCERLNKGSFLRTHRARPQTDSVRFDATSMRLEEIIPSKTNFEAAFVFLGDTEPDSCARDKKRSELVNVVAVKRVLDSLLALDIKPVFASSEYVFDGTKGNYSEKDEPKPILTYGRQKLEVERYIESRFKDYLILRFAKVYGSTPGDGTLFANWLDQIKPNAEIPCAGDQVFSPVHVDDVFNAAMRLLEKKVSGLFHLAGPRGASRLDFLKELIEAVAAASITADTVPGPGPVTFSGTWSGKPGNVTLKPVSIHDFKLLEKRPLNVSLHIDKLVQTAGFTPRDAREAVKDLLAKACVHG